MSTYGTFRDETARALSHLIASSPAPDLDQRQLAVVLGCRDIVLTSLREEFRLATGAAGHGSLRLPGVEANPAAAFGSLLSQVPTVSAGHAPTDVLTAAGDSELVAAWQRAARGCLLAADVLASTQAWRVDPTATWTVVADVADAASALSVLDPDLADLVDGRFGRETDRKLRATATCGIGLLAKLTAEVARRGPLHPRLDHLVRASTEPVNPRPLRDFTDAAAGQQRVARMLHQRQGILPVKALGPALVGQARIATEIATAASSLEEALEANGESDGRQYNASARLQEAAHDRAHALTQMARSRKAVADIMHGGEPVVWQTGEILRAVQRRPRPTDKADAQRQLRDLGQVAARGDAVHRLLVQGIEDAFATGQYLVPHPEAERLQWRPCRPDANSSLRQSARDLGRLLEENPLPRQPEPGQHQGSTLRPHSASQQLVETVDARTPCRPSSPGMRIRHPLSP